jgi:hypothetical protein
MTLFQEDFSSKYSIRNPTHPFIEIIRNSNESTDNLLPLIMQQIEFVYENKK